MLDAYGQPQSVVVLGGTSDIAGQVVRRLCERRCKTVVLAGRNALRLATAAADATSAGAATVCTVLFDASDPHTSQHTVEECFGAAGEVDLVLVAVGDVSRPGDEMDATRTADIATATYAWPAAALTAAAALLKAQGHGHIVVLSSVAGVRVRQANFAYGAAKAGLDAHASHLGMALRGTGVRLQVVRPGFVRTKMTEGLPPAPFATTPGVVADAIVAGLARADDVIWVPPQLRYVFDILKILPGPIWRRLPG